MSIPIGRAVPRNHGSIGRCKVDPSDPNLLVGPDGAGKSNSIDALRPVSESLRETGRQPATATASIRAGARRRSREAA